MMRRLARLVQCMVALGLLAGSPAAQQERTVEELDPGVGEASLAEGNYPKALAEYRDALKKNLTAVAIAGVWPSPCSRPARTMRPPLFWRAWSSSFRRSPRTGSDWA